jgi:hypothetical protein
MTVKVFLIWTFFPVMLCLATGLKLSTEESAVERAFKSPFLSLFRSNLRFFLSFVQISVSFSLSVGLACLHFFFLSPFRRHFLCDLLSLVLRTYRLLLVFKPLFQWKHFGGKKLFDLLTQLPTCFFKATFADYLRLG